MGLSEVGLRYVSEGIGDFLKNVKSSTVQVDKLNEAIKSFSSLDDPFGKANLSNIAKFNSELTKTQRLANSIGSVSNVFENVGYSMMQPTYNLEALQYRLDQTSRATQETQQNFNYLGTGVGDLAEYVLYLESLLTDFSGTMDATTQSLRQFHNQNNATVTSLANQRQSVFQNIGTSIAYRKTTDELAGTLGILGVKAATSQDTFQALPPMLQDIITKTMSVTKSFLEQDRVMNILLKTVGKFVGVQDILDFLDPTRLQQNAKDANTLSLTIARFGDSLNRIENLLRTSAIALNILSVRANNAKVAVQVLTSGVMSLARGLDTVSDFMGKLSKEVKTGDKEIQDFSKEQKVSIENTEKSTNVLWENREAIVSTAIAVGQYAQEARQGEGLLEGGPFGILLKGLQIKAAVHWFTKLPPPIQGATAALGGFLAVSVLVEAMGARAAGLSAIAQSFDKLRESAGLSKTYLDDFLKSADNQLSKGEALVLLNKALAGSQGEFQQELAASLPTFLEFARVRSAATGEDVNFLFESLIQGTKKMQPEILDNLGLVVKLTDVYSEYAIKLGKTTEQLTAQEKQMAVLNAVNSEATRNIGIFGDATLSNADRMNALANRMSDVYDSISLAVQPLLKVILEIKMRAMDLIQPFITFGTDALGFLFQILADVTQAVWTFLDPIIEIAVWTQDNTATWGAWLEVLQVVWDIFNRFLQNLAGITGILKPVIVILNSFSYGIGKIGSIVAGLIRFLDTLRMAFYNAIGSWLGGLLAPVIDLWNRFNEAINNVKTTIDQLSVVLAFGFGKAVGAMVNIMAGGAKNILKIVADLAKGIADFLIGQSPPPKGPLSKIDDGGAATFEAWMGGFTSVNLMPIEKVASDVDNTLSNIGSMSIEQVENRLARLDLGLRPFNEQLEIAKSRFEAISAPAEAALDVIDRQLDKAVEALTKGDAGALNVVKSLDAQRAAIQKNLDLQKQQVDFAQVQLALAQSRQTEERTLLNIQKNRLGNVEKETEKEAEKEKTASESKTKEEKAKSGSGTPAVSEAVSSSVPSESEMSATGSELGDWMLNGFADEMGNFEVFGEIGDEQARLGTEIGRIGEGIAGFGDRIGGAFESVFGGGGTIETLINGLFGSEGFFARKINEFFGDGGTLRRALNEVFGEGTFLGGLISNIFGESGVFVSSFNSAKTSIQNGITSIQNDFNGTFGPDGSIAHFFGDLFETTIPDFFDTAFGENSDIRTNLNSLFGADGTFATFFNDLFLEGGTLQEAVSGFFEGEKSPTELFRAVFGSDGVVTTLINDLFGEDSTISTLFSSFFGEGGYIETQINLAIDTFNQLKLDVESAINSIIGFINGENSLQTVLQAFFGEEGILGTLIDSGIAFFTNLYNSIFGEAGIFKQVATRLVELIGTPIVNLLSGLQGVINTFINTIENFLNDVLDVVEDIVEFIPQDWRGPLQDLVGFELSIPEVNFIPPNLNVAGAAKGGLFSDGLLQVGERGPELLASSSKMAVFPNNFVTAIQSLESVLVKSMSIPSQNNMGGGSSYYNNNHSNVININQPTTPASVRQQLNLMG